MTQHLPVRSGPAALARALVVACGLAMPVSAAADGPVLVELFTSQGCSSCPPADAILADLAGREDVLPLSFHVDYWDYLGWRDTFADPKNTKRQIAYRDAWNERVIYTPQMVVAGDRPVQGNRADEVAATIEAASASASAARLEVVQRDGGPTAMLTGIAPEAEIWVALFRREATVAIERGENAGREITYHHIVREVMRVGTADRAQRGIALPTPDEGEGIAVWAQEPGPGAVVAAARYMPGTPLSLAGQ